MQNLKLLLLLISLAILSSCATKPDTLNPVDGDDIFFVIKKGNVVTAVEDNDGKMPTDSSVCFSQFYWLNVVSKKTGLVIK